MRYQHIRPLDAALAVFFLLAAFPLWSGERIIELWKDVPGIESATSIMYMNDPAAKCGTAVIICPGGSYHHLGMYNEGHCTAKWFNSLGVTTFVLQYRVAEGGYHHPCQLQDIQRAIQIVRRNAASWGIDAGRIGVIGFSAGGHLVTMAGAFADTDNELAKIGADDGTNIRPDFVIPVYPVVSMRDDIANKWSRKSLLGQDMSEERKKQFSMELQIPASMPPVYLVACKDDRVVDFENSMLLDKALTEKHIDHVFASYDTGGHGFGMLDNAFMKKYHWNKQLEAWLKKEGFIGHFCSAAE